MISFLNINDAVCFLQSFSYIVVGTLVIAMFLTDNISRKFSEKKALYFSIYSLIYGFTLLLSMYLNFYPEIAGMDYFMLVSYSIAHLFLLAFAFPMLCSRKTVIMCSGILACAFAGILVFGGHALAPLLFVVVWFPATVAAVSAFIKLYRNETFPDARKRFFLFAVLQGFAILPTILLLLPPGVLSASLQANLVLGGRIGVLLLSVLLALVLSQTMSPEAEKKQTMKNAVIFLGVAIFYITAAVFLPNYLQYSARVTIEKHDQMKNDEIVRKVDRELQKIEKLTAVVSNSNILLRFLERGDYEPEASELLNKEALGLHNAIVYLLNADGTCVASSNTMLLNFDFKDRSYFRNAMETGVAFSAEMGLLTKQSGIYTARRILSEKGKALGAVVIKFNPESMHDLYDRVYLLVSPDNKIHDSSDSRLISLEMINFTGNGPTMIDRYGKSKAIFANMQPSTVGKRQMLIFTKSEFQDCLAGWSLISGSYSVYPTDMYIFGTRIMLFLGLFPFLLWICFKILQRKYRRNVEFQDWKTALFFGNPLPIFLLDESFKIMDINSALEELFGYSRDKFLFREPMHLFYSKEEYIKFRSASLALVVDRQISGLRLRFKKADGKMMLCTLSASLLSTHVKMEKTVKKIHLSAWTLIDETEESERLENAELNSALYKNLSESVSEHMFMFDKDGKFLSSNDPRIAARLAEGGESRPSLADYFAAESVIFYRLMIGNVFSKQKAMTFQHTVKIYDTEKYYQDTLYPVIINGHMTAVGGISRDITPLMRTEENLKKTEQRFAEIGRISNDMAWEINAVGQFVFCTENVAAKLGYMPENVMRMSPRKLLPGNRYKPVWKQLLKAIRAKKTLILRNELILKADGELLPVVVTCIPYFDDFGKYRGIRGICTDMTICSEMK